MDNTVLLEKECADTMVQYVHLSPKPFYELIKRCIDLGGSVIAGVLLLLPMAVIAVLIRAESEGPAIFRQERMGSDGKVFTIYKFRTMQTSAPHDMPAQALLGETQHITRIGAFLRRTSIDELPQLWNVIKGDMSLVGYRPLCLTETEANDLRKAYGVFQVRPGITGLAQINGRNNVTDEEKVRLDVQYVRERSLKLDLWCLLKTVTTVISGEGNT